MMLEHNVRRVPIISGVGRVVGIVSASDIVRLFINLHEQPIEARTRPGQDAGRA